MLSWGAVILAGGEGKRLGTRDKASITWGAATLLELAVNSCEGASAVVVVGEERPTQLDVQWARETPPGSGPAAAAVAGAAALPESCAHVLVLAVDMPHVNSATVQRLLSAGEGGEGGDRLSGGAVLVDSSGQRHLAMSLPRIALQRSMAPDASMRDLLEGLELVNVAAHGDEHHDVDTPQDLDQAP